MPLTSSTSITRIPEPRASLRGARPERSDGPPKAEGGAQRRSGPTRHLLFSCRSECFIRLLLLLCFGTIARFVAFCVRHSKAGYVELQNHTVVHQSVYGGGRGHWVLEDRFPL